MKKTRIVPITFLIYLSFFHPTTLTSSNSTDIPLDNIHLNCGSSGASSFNGVKWIGDVDSNFLPQSYDKKSSTPLVSNLDSAFPPYLNARLIRSSFTYSFPFSPGLKFVRFYFVSTSYLGLNPSKAYFSVQTGPYTLLNDFSPSVVAEELKSVYFTEDFLVIVKGTRLTITFTPSPVISSAFSFVNGIEVFSVPHSIYFSGANVPLPFLGHQAPFFINDEYALEMLYSVNAGVDRHTDVKNAFGSWLDDLSYISSSTNGSVLNIVDSPYDVTYSSSLSKYSDYAAPKELYWTARTMGGNDDINRRYNLTWSFHVDSGFKYLVRLHFCEISSDVTEVNQRVFKVYINNQTAEERMDLIALTGAPLVALYRDYVVMVPMNSERKQDLRIALHPNMESKPKYADAILNGIEIIKLSDSSKNLAARIQLKREQKGKKIPLTIFGATSGAILVLFIACFILIRRSQKGKWGTSWTVPLDSEGKSYKITQLAMNSDHCYEFTFEDIRRASHNFNEALVIGEGGFGKVYKAFIHEGGTLVAIKRCNHQSRQGVREFQNEINLLSSFHHMNLVSLLGYCHEENELILVYEYMAQGSLRDHLKTHKQTLPWTQRLQICIGAARGLHYLHTSKSHKIIHRDVKSANILLDHNLVAKISDFGLSKIGPSSTSHNHVSTEVKGTFGYLDPEYYRNRKLTEKSDVYSFGVVLFEVLSGRPAVNPFAVEEEGEKVGLVEWAFHCHLSGTIHRLVDPHLDGKINAECLMAFVDIGIKCLADKSIDRPTMGEVLSNLEKILSLQESWDEKETETNGEQPVHGIGANEEITTNTVAGEHHLNQIVHID
ncbi:hypothetical protein L6164_001884 [Bauhinia variegata]|uniref:Uncharacterized protein n=2 Tax=Bauhinia variegata TaxID=167791 RepID=A0ACB9QB26_BAUVA|nr:hypothetical protein L6164_001884 [Bauhinia variegata]